MSLRSLVIDVGVSLGRSSKDVEPYIQSLKDNWYDSLDSVADASADDLTSVGLPRRFVVELLAAAPGHRKGGGERKGKGKGKDKGKEDDRGGKGKGKSSRRSGGEASHTIRIDVPERVGDFVFRPRIIGAKGANVHHIQDQTGATIKLEGWDEDGLLELRITAPDDATLDKCVNMCDDLVNTVFAEYDELSGGGGRKGKGKGDGKGKGKKGKEKGKDKGKGKKGKARRVLGDDEIEDTVPVPTEGIDPEFYLRAKLVGEAGANVRHIESQSGCFVSVSFDDGNGMEIIIQGKEESVPAAKEMCEDLLANVLEDAGAAPKSKGGGKGKKGSKGKKRRDDDEPAHKSARTE